MVAGSVGIATERYVLQVPSAQPSPVRQGHEMTPAQDEPLPHSLVGLPESLSDIRIALVEDCNGKQWYASPRRRTVYVLAGMPIAQTAQAIIDSLLAIHEADQRRPLRLVSSRRVPDELDE